MGRDLFKGDGHQFKSGLLQIFRLDARTLYHPLRTLCSHALETLTLALALFKWNPARIVVVRSIGKLGWFLETKTTRGSKVRYGPDCISWLIRNSFLVGRPALHCTESAWFCFKSGGVWSKSTPLVSVGNKWHWSRSMERHKPGERVELHLAAYLACTQRVAHLGAQHTNQLLGAQHSVLNTPNLHAAQF